MKTIQKFVPFLVLSMLFLASCSSAASTLDLLPVAAASSPAEVAFVQTTPEDSSSQATVQEADVSLEAVEAFQGTLENIYTQVNPSVVNVDVTSMISGADLGNSPFGDSAPSQQGLGSGFIWDTEGHIVTNNHVVNGADEIRVTFADGTIREAELVGTDPNSDLAVLRVDAPADLLKPITLMDSSQIQVGQLAIAIGNPYGLSGTMTTGIVSALSRTLPVSLDSPLTQSGATYSIPDIIQTDASINPGNSGGVLVDDQGRLMGVTAAIQSSTGANAGIGFVIPSNIVQRVVTVLIETGRYDHTWMGISGVSLTPDLAEAVNLPSDQQGALVMEVVPGGPAEQAGLRGGSQGTTLDGQQALLGGDVIIAIDDRPVQYFEDMVSYLYNETEVGQMIELTVIRDGEQQTIQVTLGALPTNQD